ncbi:MAG: nucleoside monophosphate kinase [Steroidobacteraceae bacterium]
MERFGIPQISTGDLLRAAVQRGTEYGLRAKAAMDAGQLVVDEIVLGIIRDRLAEPDAQKGFILDGFPRNQAQAEALGHMLKAMGQPLDAVVLFEVDSAELVRRISGRHLAPAPAVASLTSPHGTASGHRTAIAATTSPSWCSGRTTTRPRSRAGSRSTTRRPGR